MIESSNRVEISRGALRHNFLLCRSLAGEAGILAMVKADGYGHGMVECARVFGALGATAFGVAEIGEGVTLRRAGITAPILIFTSLLPEMIAELLAYNLTPIVAEDEILSELSRQAVARGTTIGLHLKVDVGMGRQGCLAGEAAALVARIASLPGLRLAGVMAHFPMADEQLSPSTPEIFARFQREVIPDLQKISAGTCILHIANSGAIIYFPATRLDWVRPGIMLYGYHPAGPGGRELGPGLTLRPAMRFVSRVIQLREVPAGTGLGYGHTIVTTRPTRLAVIPVGYANGYPRSLSNKARVLIRGRRVPLVGRVSMNLILADITELEGVHKGAEVVLLGRQGAAQITADELAAWMGTISYEVLCLLGNLNRKVYVD